MDLRSALGIGDKEIVSLVGGGGKTTLMFALAREVALCGGAVVTTTTTKIFKPAAVDTFLIVESDEDKIVSKVTEGLRIHRHITVASEELANGKLRGISPELVDALIALGPVSCIVVEADGAAGRPVKAPNDTEPVIPAGTSLVVPVVGIDALGCRLGPDAVFRHELAAGITGLEPGKMIGAAAIADLVTHPGGMAKGSPAGSRIIPLINKMDLVDSGSEAVVLARMILDRGRGSIERVVLGQLRSTKPIVGIVSSRPAT
jgi:probable selenium-dependent hydroxylase accessory protein YqeC